MSTFALRTIIEVLMLKGAWNALPRDVRAGVLHEVYAGRGFPE